MTSVAAYAAQSATAKLAPFKIDRREPTPHDVNIDILYCGVCHSDIHMSRNEWGFSLFPIVPGHEIVGRVKSVGSKVTLHKVGDLVAVGCLVDSCQQCGSCHDHLEQYCEGGMVGTYGSRDPKHNNDLTFGGYSEEVVVDEKFVLRVPTNLDVKATAPLLCAGITTWSPLRHWKVGPGQTVGVIGLGGLGHMGVKFAHALGAKVVMITTSPSKADDARALGADEVLISSDPEAMKNAAGKFHFLLNTIPVGHDINPYVSLLKRDGTMCIVGALDPLKGAINTGALVVGRRSVAGSIIGGIKETQEMLDFCGEHNIVSDVELVNIENINTAYDRMLKSDVKYRFVIDNASLKK
ncbi:MAG: hydroxyacid dehydrogenase [Verrucomicrobiaceae bacterium]|nr:hydroxyacid dehydrogenase [Verrucomicrobiaceae bacterium]